MVTWLALLVIMQGLLAAATDVRERPWPGRVLLGFIAYAAFPVWFAARKMQLIGRPIFELLLAFSATPAIVGTGLAGQGAETWSLWAALLGSGGLLVMSVVLTEPTPMQTGSRRSSPRRILASVGWERAAPPSH